MTRMMHYIEDISFARDWVACECGHETTVPLWDAHRKEMGMTRSAQIRVPKGIKKNNTAFRIKHSK